MTVFGFWCSSRAILSASSQSRTRVTTVVGQTDLSANSRRFGTSLSLMSRHVFTSFRGGKLLWNVVSARQSASSARMVAMPIDASATT